MMLNRAEVRFLQAMILRHHKALALDDDLFDDDSLSEDSILDFIEADLYAKGAFGDDLSDDESDSDEVSQDDDPIRCPGHTKDGRPCKNTTRHASGRCPHHREDAKAKSKKGTKGGSKKGKGKKASSKGGKENARRCSALTSKGHPCKNTTTHSSGLCHCHL